MGGLGSNGDTTLGKPTASLANLVMEEEEGGSHNKSVTVTVAAFAPQTYLTAMANLLQVKGQ